jgi:tape measure domain-containing protein
MADLSYDVRVNTRDAVNSINGLKTALTGLASAFAVGQVVQFADSITSLRNKLLTLTPDVNAVNKQFNALAAIAITSRAPLEATGDLFFRIQRSAKALGISTAEAATITESLAKAMSASGLSAGEAAGPLLQLGQALQSGVFQGDELRSILEGMPVVAQALATELGVPVGALKKLGSEGQISADVFVKAMRRARDSIDEAFGRTTPTISSAIEGLRTNAKLAFDQFENSTQTGRTLGATIEYLGFQMFKLSKNIDDIIQPLGTFLKIIGAVAAFTLFGKALSVIGGLTRGLVSGFQMMGARISNVKDIISNFGGVMNAVGKNFTGFAEVILYILSPFAKLVSLIISGAAALYAWSGISNFIDKIKSLGDSTSDGALELAEYRAELAKMKEGLDDTAGPAENLANAAAELAKKLGLARREMSAEVAGLDRGLKQTQERLALENEFLKANQDRIMVSQSEIDIAKMLTDIDIERRNTLAGLNDQLALQQQAYANMVKKDSEAGKEAAGRIGILREQIKRTGEVYDKHAVGMARLTQNNQNLKLLEEDRRRTQENIIKSIDDQISRNQKLGDVIRGINDRRVDLKFETSLRGLSPLRKQIANINEEARKAALSAGQAFAQAFEDDGTGLTPEKAAELTAGLDQIANAYKGIADEQIKSLRVSEQYLSGNLDSLSAWREEFKLGSQNAFIQFRDDANDAGKQAANSFSTFTSGMEDAFVQFVQTGKLSFKSLANSIIADLVRIAVRRAIVAAIGGPLGSLFGFANGGPVMGGTPIIVGERGPELFVPQSAGKVINNSTLKGSGQSPSSSGAQTTVNYNIQAVDAASFRSLVAKDPSFIYAVTEQGRRSQPTRSR